MVPAMVPDGEPTEMKTITPDNASPGSHPWPKDEMESVANCPYCAADQRTLAYSGVEDWTFGSAPGKWDYWRCGGCGALYLDPRPTPASIGKAYARYYTHTDTARADLVERLKTLLRNTCYLAWHGIPLRPRLPWPSFLHVLLDPLRRRIAEPFFILSALNRLPRGRLMDVGCGNGANLEAARQLGWVAQGIELDPRAIATARAQGLDVIEGDYHRLAEFEGAFDCIVCSHVIEHVHAPLELLRAIHAALKPGGTALVSLPNADSAVLEIVGENWRGLEAPRHLAIPTSRHLCALVERMGFAIDATPVSPWVTLQESLAIAQRRGLPDLAKHAAAALNAQGEITAARSDFINLVLKRDVMAVGSRFSRNVSHCAWKSIADRHRSRSKFGRWRQIVRYRAAYAARGVVWPWAGLYGSGLAVSGKNTARVCFHDGAVCCNLDRRDV